MRKLVLLLLAACACATSAQAATARPSMAAAEAAIRRYEGPGTTIARCWRVSARAVECRFRTPGENIGVAESGWVFEGWAVAHAGRHGVTVKTIS